MTSCDDRPTVLIAALSGRALAVAAYRTGYVPLVADLFDDLDTAAIAGASTRVAGSLRRGFDAASLLDALDRLRAGRAPVGVVCGSGFEGRPKLLRAIAARHVLLGNPAGIVARVKDPAALATLCARLGVPHPETPRAADDRGRWLRKRVGASGGGHVRPADPTQPTRRGHYLQRQVEGTPISALFLADGQRGMLLGLSRQWTDPTPRRPYRYGGAVRPASLTGAQRQEIAGIVARLVPATGLVGLNSADFLVRSDGLDLIEINPRPGATIDIFVDTANRLFRLHLDACMGRLPTGPPDFPPAAAAAVVYAPRRLDLLPTMTWPAWTADRQRPGPVPKGAPLCTVLAEAADAETAEQVVRARGLSILSIAGGIPCQ